MSILYYYGFDLPKQSNIDTMSLVFVFGPISLNSWDSSPAFLNHPHIVRCSINYHTTTYQANKRIRNITALIEYSLPSASTRAMGPRFSISKQPAIKERRVSGSGTKVKSESYEQVRRIGAGGQGKVWIVKRKSDKKVLVRKEQKEYTMLGEKPMEQQVFERFIRGHPRIIEFDHANFIAADHTLVLYFEHCQGGDLHDYIPRYGEKGCSERFLVRHFSGTTPPLLSHSPQILFFKR